MPEGEPLSLHAQCPHCGATVKDGQEACLACGAPLLPLAADENRARWAEFLERANQTLLQAASGAAESAFGVGCSLGVLGSLLIWLIAFAAGLRNWIVLFILGFGMALSGVGIAVILAQRARSATLAGLFQSTLAAQFRQQMKTYRISEAELNALSDEVLAPDAPLRSFLPRLTNLNEPQTEEP